MVNDFDKRPFPNVGNSIFYNKEFTVGQMLPQVPISNSKDVIRKNADGDTTINYDPDLGEWEITETKRSNLSDSDFGIPEERKFPLDTRKHVESAIKLFGHANPKYKKELARRIKVKADEMDIKINEDTQCYKYLTESKDLANEDSYTNMWFVLSDDGVENCCLTVSGYDKPLRGRSAMIVLNRKNNNWYILSKLKGRDYGVPGGGWDKNETPEHAAIRELQEEAQTNVKNVRRYGTLIEYRNIPARWVQDHVSDKSKWWYGYYSAVFVGLYNGRYKGMIDPKDKESGYSWIKLDSIRHTLPKEYTNAIDRYICDMKL